MTTQILPRTEDQRITFHQGLAQAVNVQVQAIRYCYVIWANERHDQAVSGYMFTTDLLDSYQALFSSRSYLKEIIRAGEGIFWTFGSRSSHATISFFGLEKVLENLQVTNRGRAILVLPHLVFNRKALKRTLMEVSLMFKADPETWAGRARMARDTIESITAIDPRTQRRWQEGQPRTYNFSGERGIGDDGQEYSPRQLGNTYSFGHTFKHRGQAKRFAPGFVDTTVKSSPYELQAIVDGKLVRVKRRTFYMHEKEARKQARALWLTGDPDRKPVFLYKGKSAQGEDLWDRLIDDGYRVRVMGDKLVLEL